MGEQSTVHPDGWIGDPAELQRARRYRAALRWGTGLFYWTEPSVYADPRPESSFEPQPPLVGSIRMPSDGSWGSANRIWRRWKAIGRQRFRRDCAAGPEALLFVR